MASVRLGIRAALHDAAGMGHLSRCLALAEALDEMGHEVVFIAPEPSTRARHRLASAGLSLIATTWPAGAGTGDQEWPAEAQLSDSSMTARLLATEGVEAVFVDDYGLGRAWDRASSDRYRRIGTVEDFPDRRRACHLIVDTVGTRDHLHDDRARTLSGPRYALLRREVLDLRESVWDVRGDGGVVAFIGAGAAAAEAWPLIIPDLRAVVEAGHPVRAVAPESGSDVGPSMDGLSLMEVTEELGSLFATASLLVTGGGVTALEAACLGRPTLLLEIAPNQHETIGLLTRAGAARAVGRPADLSVGELRAEAIELLASEDGREEMITAGRRLVDGLGASRVALALSGSGGQRVTVRPATSADVDRYFDWFMDPATRAASLDQSPVTRESHVKWFASRVRSGDAALRVAMLGRLPIGQVRLEVEDDDWVLDYSLDPVARGMGLARPMLRAALQDLRPDGRRIVAAVRRTNIASVRTLLGLGFRETPPRRPPGPGMDVRWLALEVG